MKILMHLFAVLLYSTTGNKPIRENWAGSVSSTDPVEVIRLLYVNCELAMW